ncbi:MAG: SCP2 sterol-binding domain-containing protein [Deltaproteobacteria bacterium]|nr:SCP2 sterol-binding domain-containing protein [Deltaproteobacteria bacterium]
MAYTTTARQFVEGGGLLELLARSAPNKLTGLIKLEIEGDGGGTWYLDPAKNSISGSSKQKPACIVRAQARDFMALVEGRMSPADGVLTERLHIAGSAAKVSRLMAVLATANPE